MIRFQRDKAMRKIYGSKKKEKEKVAAPPADASLSEEEKKKREEEEKKKRQEEARRKAEEKKRISKERQTKIAKRKSDITVSVLKHNQAMKQLVDSMNAALTACKETLSKLTNQRELIARTKMTERVLNSSIRLMTGNKLQLWMIDERGIEEEMNE